MPSSETVAKPSRAGSTKLAYAIRPYLADDAGAVVPAGEVGELVARGDNVMEGYWKDPVASAEVLTAEGLRTRDLARLDADGYVWIVGRKDDVIKSGAYRISPQEIEEVLAEIEGIAPVAGVGAPEPVAGTMPASLSRWPR